ncbi:MAG: hypothetical protein LBD09_03475 [Treponema sp.]|jgi:hypothetical protein|nr:hypothetical protein [Treponema sp.]
MKTSEKPSDKEDEIVIKGRVFKPVYKNLLDNMPRDLVQEMARRRLDELKSGAASQKKP